MMLVTLVWKEFCEHRAIWFTMVVMTCLLGMGLARVVAPDDPATALAVASLSILGMAGAYGVVCGAMMLAGEHEGGTLVFLDIYLGRRHLLWFSKFLIGVLFAAAEATLVAGVLVFFKQAPPAWAPALVGSDAMLGGGMPGGRPEWGPLLWFYVLPVVTIESFAWGLFGSAFTRRVLSAAALATLVAAPIWLLLVNLPAPIFLVIRLLAAFTVLLISYAVFFSQARDTTTAVAAPLPAEVDDPRRRFMEIWAEYEREERAERTDRRDRREEPVAAAAVLEPIELEPIEIEPIARAERVERTPTSTDKPHTRRRKAAAAGSPLEALTWLTFLQARDLCLVLAGLAILVGLFLPLYGQLLWPLATMLVGVACGVAAFAPEQRDLSYQFLASQHLPLPSIWRFKIGFWALAALVITLILVFSGMVVVLFRVARGNQGQPVPLDFALGTLREVLGPMLFFGVWLVYGFCSGQVLVWLCRKTILAALLSLLVGGAALGLWLPSVLCRGMSSWPLWIPPLVMLVATQLLVRAWAGGRIKERKPQTALIGSVAVMLVWVAANLGYRAIEVPDVGAPLDPVAFRESIAGGDQNRAALKIQEAVTLYEERPKPNPQWLVRVAAAARLPAGVLEPPRADGGAPLLRYSAACERMAEDLRVFARKSERVPAFEQVAQILALSRSLRNKAPAPSYLGGVRVEESGLEALDEWLKRGKPSAEQLERVLKELNRHAAEMKDHGPKECADTECFRAGGLVTIPNSWSFASPSRDARGRIPERWLAGAIAVSLELPWEDERKLRIWQLVWGGLMRGVEAKHWELPATSTDPGIGSDATRTILRGWLPADGSLSRVEIARLLDASWLTDERLYCPVPQLRTAGTRSQWRVRAARLTVALALYEMNEQKPAAKLGDLVPKYLPELPVDPYSGQPLQYRVSPGERIQGIGDVPAGQGVLWSTGPDHINNNARQAGRLQGDDDSQWPHDPQWARVGMDLVKLVPRWQ